jgi:hypothetical protein
MTRIRESNDNMGMVILFYQEEDLSVMNQETKSFSASALRKLPAAGWREEDEGCQKYILLFIR